MSEENSTGYIPAIFTGRNRMQLGDAMFMPGIHKFWLPIDVHGEIMDITDDKGNYVDPTTKEEFLTRQVYELVVGESVMIPGPTLDQEAYDVAVNCRMFAKIKHQREIKKQFKAGKSANEIRDYLDTKKGFIAVAKPVEPIKYGG